VRLRCTLAALPNLDQSLPSIREDQPSPERNLPDSRDRLAGRGPTPARRGAAAERVPTRELPNWLVRLAPLADPTLKQITPELRKTKNGINEKARRLLGWAPAVARGRGRSHGGELGSAGLLKAR
jgi:hypothetical protein